MWSIIECGIGLIAGSLPMLRRLFKLARAQGSSSATPAPSAHPSLVTFGGGGGGGGRSGASGRFRNPTDVGVSMATIRTSRHSNEWEKLDDCSGKDGHYIMAQRDVTVDFEMADLGRSKSANGSTEKLRR